MSLWFFLASLWVFIASGSIREYNFLPKSILSVIGITAVVWSILGLICSVGLLMLKWWARKAVVILVIWATVMAVIFAAGNHLTAGSEIKPDRAALEKDYEKMKTDAPKEFKMTQEEYINFVTSVQLVTYHVFEGIFNLLTIGYLLLVWFYFTRKKVKAQFTQIAAPPAS